MDFCFLFSRTVAHAAALQSLAVSAAQARSEVTTHATSVRTDSKHDPKHTEAANIRVDARAEVRTGTRPEIRQQGRVEVRTVDSQKSDRTAGKLDPRTDIRYTTYMSPTAVNAQKHPYMAGMAIPRMPGGATVSAAAAGHTMVHSVASSGVTSVSSSAVTTQSKYMGWERGLEWKTERTQLLVYHCVIIYFRAFDSQTFLRGNLVHPAVGLYKVKRKEEGQNGGGEGFFKRHLS